MPNHVHVVFRADETLDRILQSWKSFTAKASNEFAGGGTVFSGRKAAGITRFAIVLTSIGSFGTFSRTPVKAGLHDWPFVRSYPDRY